MKKENKIGIYRKNQKGFGFVKLENQEEEVYISRDNSLNALNGDTVSIQILNDSNKEIIQISCHIIPSKVGFI